MNKNCNKLKWNNYHRYPISNEISIPKKYHVQAYFPNYAPISNFIGIYPLYPISTNSLLRPTTCKTFSTSGYIKNEKNAQRRTRNSDTRITSTVAESQFLLINSASTHTHTHTHADKFAHDRVSASSSYLYIRYITFSHSSNRIRNRKHSHLDFEGNACEFLFLPPSCCRRNFDVSARAGMATILEK